MNTNCVSHDRMPMSNESLQRENDSFAGSFGVSRRNRAAGFRPAFRDTETGRVVLARFADGRPAPMHILEGLPREWAVSFDDLGCPSELKPSIIAGFVRGPWFFTREEAAHAC